MKKILMVLGFLCLFFYQTAIPQIAAKREVKVGMNKVEVTAILKDQQTRVDSLRYEQTFPDKSDNSMWLVGIIRDRAKDYIYPDEWLNVLRGDLFVLYTVYFEGELVSRVEYTGFDVQEERIDEEGWRIVAEWEGQGIKNTQAFAIKTKEWKICWITKADEYGGALQIYIYDAKTENLEDVAANVIGDDENCSFMRKAGVWYLKINSSQSWYVVVKEKLIIGRL